MRVLASVRIREVIFYRTSNHGLSMIPQTYRAVLRGDRLHWIDTPPVLEGDTEVLITFTQPESEAERRDRGRQSAAALERIARAGGIASIPDPSAWQREIRKDRPLPGRED